MPGTLEFLQAILPREGLYCAVVINDGRSRQYFYESIEQLAASIQRIDAGFAAGNGAVYHGCASYKPGGRRTKDAVLFVRSLWLDVDVGGSGYESLGAAIEAVKAFQSETGLPVPLLVSSGRGLHVYWPLDTDLSRREWERYARGLKRLCELRGLRAGPERTADCASILRPPGTTHRKGDPRPVVCGPIAGPYPLNLFGSLLDGDASDSGAAGDHGSPLAGLWNSGKVLGPGSGLFAKLANVTAAENIDFNALTEGCAQLRRFKETHGKIPEPIWYAGLGVLAFCAGGDDIAQQWSSGHNTYSPAETARRLDRARNLSGPPGCQHFRSLDAGMCEGCGFGDTTPLEAAREVRAHRKVKTEPVKKDEELPPRDGAFNVEGYVISDGSLYYRAEKITKNGQSEPVDMKVASFPVEVRSVHSGEVNKQQNYYLMRHWKPHQGWEYVDLPASKFYGPLTVQIMADFGVVVHDSDLFRKYVRESVELLQREEKNKMQFDQFGWKEGNKAFLYGELLYSTSGKERAAVSQELRYRAQWLRPVPGGSVAGWKQAVDCLMGQGSEGMSFTILASFGAALMRFLEDNEGGAIVSLMTKHSGAGKTTSLAGAYTVWSESERGLGLTTIDTKVSKGVTLGALCNLPITYDEFSNKDPAVVREFVLLFTSGRDKMRADSSGQIIHAAASWQTILLTASNRSLVETLLSTGESEAPAMRVLEFPVESSGNLTLTEASRLKKQLEMNAGWAGDAFLTYMMQPGVMEWVRKKLDDLTDEIFKEGGFRKEHRFWVRALAAAGTAAVMVEHLGLISFSPKRIMGWAVKHFSDKIEESRDRGSMLPMLARFMNDHLSETLIMPGPSQGRVPMPPIGEKPRNKVSVRVEIKGDTAYITDFVLRRWMAANGGGYNELIAELQTERVLLHPKKMVTLTAGTELRSGSVNCIGIDIGHPMFTGVAREVLGGTFQEKAEHEASKIARLRLSEKGVVSPGRAAPES